jgi:hypothetical protein
MDRVETILQKLQQQFKEGASAEQLLLTAQMLQHELIHVQDKEPIKDKGAVVVSMPFHTRNDQLTKNTDAVAKPLAEEKIMQVLEMDEEEVAAELEELKRNAAVRQHMTSHSKPQLLFDAHEDEIPTLAQHNLSKRTEINESVGREASSLNERLKEMKIEISEKLNDTPVKDLKKAIGINDRFLYINDLFRGDEAMYERSIKTINSFLIWPEAEYWIRRELKTKLGWTEDNETVKQFDQLVKRRFS